MTAIRNSIAGLASGFAVIFTAFAAAAQPEPELSVSQWAEKHRRVGEDSQSRFPGKWENSRAPYLVEPMDACQVGNGIRRVVLTGSAQFGKSECPINAMGQNICSNAPRSWIVILPAHDEVTKYAQVKLDANIKATEIWRERVLATTARSAEGSSTRAKKFRGGAIRLLTSGSSKPLQMITAGAAVFEECAQYEAQVGEGGDPITAAEQRMTTYGLDAKSILCSTPGFVGRCRITAEYNASDMRKWHTPCPHCKAFFVLDFATLQEHEGRPCFTCPGCSGRLEETHRREMTLGGLWIPTFEHPEPDADTCAFTPDLAEAMLRKRDENPAPPVVIPAGEIQRWRDRDCEGRPHGYWLWKAQASPSMSSWVVILEDWRKVQRGEGGVPFAIEFAQKTQGVPYQEVVERPDFEKLYEARGVIYPTARIGVPDWASLVTMSIDVQANRLEHATYAWGRGGVGARIMSGVIPKSPLSWSTWSDDAARLVNTMFSGPSFKSRLADYVFIDSGGNATENVYNFVLPLQHRPQPVLAIKGDSHDKGDAIALRKGNIVPVRRGGVVVGKVAIWLIGTHGLKSRVYEGLAGGVLAAETKQLAPRSLHFPREMTKDEFKQLTAEHLKRDDPGRRGVWVKPQGVANEQLDLAVYCMAGAINAMMDSMDEAQWASLAAARAPDKVKAELTPIELLALPADDPVRIAAEEKAPTLEPPPAEGVNKTVTEEDLAKIEALGRAWGGQG